MYLLCMCMGGGGDLWIIIPGVAYDRLCLIWDYLGRRKQSSTNVGYAANKRLHFLSCFVFTD